MKAPAFAYARPHSLPEALALLAQYGQDGRVLAGGQTLMATLNMRLDTPEVLIDINQVPGLAGIDYADGTLRIGAMTRHVEIERSPLVAQHAPLIAEAMPHVAHAAIRNRGTIGGSIAFADPAAELPACALALEARFVIESAQGRRVVAAEDFFQGLYRTALEREELLTAIEIPAASPDTRSGFAELSRRHGDYAITGVTLQGKMTNNTFTEARLVYFAVADRPILAIRAAAVLIGRANDTETRDAVLLALQDDLDPVEDLSASAEMRLHLARVLTKRLLERIAR